MPGTISGPDKVRTQPEPQSLSLPLGPQDACLGPFTPGDLPQWLLSFVPCVKELQAMSPRMYSRAGGQQPFKRLL